MPADFAVHTGRMQNADDYLTDVGFPLEGGAMALNLA
jgi:hypothetical protein